MSQDIAILDFGSSKLTIHIGKRGTTQNSLVLTASQSLKYEGFSEGEWLKPQSLIKDIEGVIIAAERQANIKLSDIYVGVPAEFSACAVREASLSLEKRRRVTEDDLSRLAQMGDTFAEEAPSYTLIHCQPISYTLDDERRTTDSVVGSVSSKLSAQLSYILAETRFVDGIKNIMNELNVRIIDFVSSPLAQAMYLLNEQKRDFGAVIIDVGYITTSVAVVKGDGLLTLGCFSMGGGHISADLLNLGATFNEAEKLKRSVNITVKCGENEVYPLGDKEYEVKLVNNFVMARIELIAANIKKCLKLSNFQLSEGAGCYLTGGGLSYMHGIPQLLTSILNCDVELALSPNVQMDNPELSSSLGLLNMVLGSDDQPLPVAPPPKKKGFFARLFGGKS